MILLLAVVIGLAGGLIRAAITKTNLIRYRVDHLWLVVAAFIPQWLAFSFPLTRLSLPDPWVRASLVLSQLLLLIFALLNARSPGFLLMMAGVGLNLVAITLNGGLMPVTPETVAWMAPGTEHLWEVGARFGHSKEIVLSQAETKFWILTDIIRSPGFLPFRAAMSVGDMILSLGAIQFLLGLTPPQKEME